MAPNDPHSAARRQHCRTLDRDDLARLQSDKLAVLLARARQDPFYVDRMAGVSSDLPPLEQLKQVPPLTKQDLLGSAGEPGRIFTQPRHNYVRFHQTSGTSGWPMPVLDTADDWSWWLECWQYVLDAGQVTADDVAMMAFSFGPFIGFWSAHDAFVGRGVLVIPGGGLSTDARLQLIEEQRCTVVCCTPTYAMHLATIAAQRGIDLAASSVRCVIVAGEPGGSMPVVRQRIQQAWGATVIDHSGASEVGAWGFGSDDGAGLHVIESEFVAETLQFDDQHPFGNEVADGESAELVLTNLGRLGGPAIRYRTGDIVRATRQHDYECRFQWLDSGVLGRADDMIVIRGVNVFPSSVESVIREVNSQCEFRITAFRESEMDQLSLEVECSDEQVKILEQLLRDRLAMRVAVQIVPAGSLPRFEAKARRWVDKR